ncbi:T9SS type A sorting domain-containing protein [Gaetbulibacter jejuensis]|uniref:T9SS type A sorting domain-containing protein n=1 Tax=Gaetbulibacter jejuensis TaxID=584607 RepID=UPI00300B3D2A
MKNILLSMVMLVFLSKVHAQTFNGNVTFTYQQEINDFGANGYTEINGNLAIVSNEINDLSPLSSLTTLTGFLDIHDNSLITNLDGLSNMTSIGGNIYIYSNAVLTNVDGLSGLNIINGLLRIDANPLLTSLNGLSNITDITGRLQINENAILTNFDGLNNLQTLGDDLKFVANPNLVNIEALSSVTSVGDDLFISNNDALENLNGLENITFISNDIKIQLNDNLEDFCSLQDYFLGGTFSGGYTVYGNAYNPTQQEMVDDNCSTLSVEDVDFILTKVYPNPVTSHLYIEAKSNRISKVNAITLQGSEISLVFENGMVDCGHLTSGVYFIQVITEHGLSKVFRIIKH